MEAGKRVRIMDYNDDFYESLNLSGRKLILYGMGCMAERIYPHFQSAAYICDQKIRDEDGDFHGIPFLRSDRLESLDDKLIILICVEKEAYREQIKNLLIHMSMDALVFEFFHNKAFHYFRPQIRHRVNEVQLKKVHIVYDSDGWILNKFAVKLKEELLKKGVSADIGRDMDFAADINHCISYPFFGTEACRNSSIMITHIDSVNKLNLLKYWMETVRIGICMSRDTMEQLTMAGVPREKLCYINPAQDGIIKPEKYVLGITHRIYQDHRKREEALLDICDGISPEYFEFKIMGQGWEEIIEKVRKKGFSITYYNAFDYDTYVRLMPSLDFYLFWGFDEGSMGYLDAVAAGVGTIVTPQGFHLDVRNESTYFCRTISDFIDTLSNLEIKKKRAADAVAEWTWENYAKKHMEVWEYILGKDNVYQNKHKYEDGIFSMMCVDA